MSPTAGSMTPDAQILYISDSAAGHIVPVAIDLRAKRSADPVGQIPRTCMLTPGGDMLLAVDTASNDLAVIRAKTGGLITLIPVGSHPRDLAVKGLLRLRAVPSQSIRPLVLPPN